MKRRLEVTLRATAEVDDDRWLSKPIAEALWRYAREPEMIDGTVSKLVPHTYYVGGPNDLSDVVVEHSYRQWNDGVLDSRHRMLWAPEWLRRWLGYDQAAR